MEKKILVIPDVHGRLFWKDPAQKYVNEVDRIVFLGDYLDPYPQEDGPFTPEGILHNLMDIIHLKQEYPDKVILLKGNHDEHYSSQIFCSLARATRCDRSNWSKYYEVFSTHEGLFQLAWMEECMGIPYVFTHAGLSAYWLHKVNENIWQLPDDELSITHQDIIDRLNGLDSTVEGAKMLSIVGFCRSRMGEKTGSMLWADVNELGLRVPSSAYDLDKVFQVFGHTRLDGERIDMLKYEHAAMIDSQKCFMIAEGTGQDILTLGDYEKGKRENRQ